MEKENLLLGSCGDDDNYGDRFRVQYDIRHQWNAKSNTSMKSFDCQISSGVPSCHSTESSSASAHTGTELSEEKSSSSPSPSFTASLSDYSWNAGCSIARIDSLEAFSSPSPTSSHTTKTKLRSMTNDSLPIIVLPSHTDDNKLYHQDENDDDKSCCANDILIARNHSSMKDLFFDSASISVSSRPVAPKRKKSHRVSYLTHKSMNRQSIRLDILDDASWNSMFNCSVKRNDISQRKNVSPMAGNRQQNYQPDNSNDEFDSLLGALPSPISTRQVQGDDVSVSSKCDRSTRKQLIIAVTNLFHSIVRNKRLCSICMVFFILFGLSIIFISLLGLKNMYPINGRHLSTQPVHLDNENVQATMVRLKETSTTNKQNLRLGDKSSK
jgi:hypothetical protein